MQTIDQLITEYEVWQAENDLKLGSADDHLYDPDLTHDQREWLMDFVLRWERVSRIENERGSL